MTATKRICESILLTLALLGSQPNFALADMDNQSISDDLNQIEMRIFQREYPNDSTEIRLSRIEQAVCGETESGPTDERLSHLLTVIPNLGDDNQSQSQAPMGGQNQPQYQQYQQQPDDQDDATAANYVPASEEYPAINQLEREILGTTYVQDPVATRLSRLEQRAFGKPSASNDLSERTDMLKSYAQRSGLATPELAQDLNGGEQPNPQSGPSYVAEPYQNQAYQNQQPQSQPYLNQPFRSQNYSAQANQYPQQSQPGQLNSSAGPAVAWQPAPPSIQTQLSLLEQRVFGKIYNSESIPKRLKRLDKAVFPKQPINTFTPISSRINQLNNAVFPQPAFSYAPNSNLSSLPSQTTGPLTSQPTGTQTQQAQQQQANNNGHPILRSLGRMLVPALEEGGSMLGGGFGI